MKTPSKRVATILNSPTRSLWTTKKPDIKVPRKRKRNILWFNPPFSSSVQTNIGKRFFALICKHFGEDSRYHKLFNGNTVKLSYSCMPNIGMIIKSHNARLLSKNNGNKKACSCRDKIQCPLDGNCMQTSLVYEAEASIETEKFRYIGLCECDFKTRFNTHKSSLGNQKYRNSTELSERIWALKDSNVEHTVKWKILQITPARRCGAKRCSLCLSEKYHIINYQLQFPFHLIQ